MPIITEQIGDIKDVLTLDFNGTGDIVVASSFEDVSGEKNWETNLDKVNKVCFFQDIPRGIGNVNEVFNTKNSDELDKENEITLKATMVFSNTRSIDVVIEKLNLVKKSLEKTLTKQDIDEANIQDPTKEELEEALYSTDDEEPKQLYFSDIPITTYGELSYNAYCETKGIDWVSKYSGAQFSELLPEVKDAWENAAKVIEKIMLDY